MNTPPTVIQVCSSDNGICVKIEGRADCSRSVDFKQLATSVLNERYAHYELDLTQCAVMDSTFLGVLCGFAEKVEATDRPGDERHVILFNPNQRITELLENLGVDYLFRVERGEPVVREDCVPASDQDGSPSREELRATSLEAHRRLIALNPENAPKFKDLTEFLAADLKRLRSKA